MKKISVLALCFVFVLTFSVSSVRALAGEPAAKLKVSVSFEAMKEFAEAVGGDLAEVSVIVPAGGEPHDFEPKARDIMALASAKVFVANGLGMEPWAEEAIRAAGNAGLIAVEASSGADVIKNTDLDEIDEHGEYDPHVWLSLNGAAAEVKNIADAFIEADPSNREYYEKNRDEYTERLTSLYREYSEKFRSVSRKNFVTGHAAFAYLCREFGLEQNSVEDAFAEGEPSARQLAELVEYCRKNGVTTIFSEEAASPEISRTLAGEVGADVVPIYTIEGPENGMTYLERMTENLSRIYESLGK
ncbi:MAG: metal ABC transporter substrate-binding protein [Synergistaceae bacterium]|nr:metal ABC transporter substrate-binding protein [Synergistaceae bacterium]